jgi:hypothetical protein
MKMMKLTDLAAQLLIPLGSLVCISFPDDSEFRFIYLYFLTGGWQILSLITHLFLNKSWINRKERNQYGLTVLWVLVIGFLSYIFLPLFMYFLFGLLLVSPVLAIWYFVIGIGEWKRIKQRELIHLK